MNGASAARRRLSGRNVTVQKITPFLWFDHQAEEAANFYVSIFKDARIVSVSRYAKEGTEVHGRPAGSVMTVEFQLEGQRFVALNGGPHFTFSPAISLVVDCKTQDEVDHYWRKLSQGGYEPAQQCGWLQDKFGLSWQIVPSALVEMLKDKDPERSGRVMSAMLKMKKIDIAKLRQAYAG